MGRATKRILAAIGAVLLASLLLVTPALAGGGSNGSGYTEDNDTNDGNTPNNVSDDGDNKHPSGQDRSVENGGSGNQGNSGSDPDGDSNGGADKPNGSGGTDKADQDGNNGCGNDDDFEDDNNGNCGPKDKDKDRVRGSRNDCPAGSTMPGKSGGKGKGKGKNGGKGKRHCDEPVPSATAGVGGTVEGSGSTTDDPEVLGGVIESDPETEGDEVLGDLVTNDGDAVAAERESRGSALPFTGGAIFGILAAGLGLITSGYLFMRRRSQS